MPQKPNIILIFPDQHRGDAMGCVNPAAQTPSLDRLAAEGVRFGAAYIQPLWFTRGQVTLMWERKTRHGTEHRVGMEYLYRDRLMLRVGYNGVDPVTGIGFRFGAVECDYALSFYDLGAIHRLSGSLQF